MRYKMGDAVCMFRIIIVILLGIETLGCHRPTLQNSDPPNILLINVDDLGYMDTQIYGSSDFETPHLLDLAARGMTFTQAYAAAANCAPSRACMLTGLYGPRHGIYTVGSSERGDSRNRKLIPVVNRTILQDSLTTLAEELRTAGYRTMTVGKWHLGEDPLRHGFEVNIAGNHAGHPKSHFSPYNNPDLKDGPAGENLNDRLTREAVALLSTTENPFFLYLPFYAVHTPLQGKEHLVEKYQKKGFEIKKARYAAMVENMDANIGYLLNSLDSLGLRKNTLIVFTSDNGGIAAIHSQTPLRGGKGSYYEGGVRVPLIVTWADHIQAGSRSDMPVSNIDFYPTLLAIAGQKPNPEKALDGLDISPELTGRKMNHDRPIFWHFPIYLQAYDGVLDDSRDALFRTRPGSVMLQHPWKIHHYFEDDEWELYHLDSDPGERSNLMDQYPEKVRELRNLLNIWRNESGAIIPSEVNPEYRGVGN